MKITIDTQQDNHEDIKKVIKMLQHLVGSESYSNYSSETKSRNIFDDPSPSLSTYSEESKSIEDAAPTNAFSAMFGDNASEPVSSSSEDKVEAYGEYKPKKLDLDAEIIPY